MSNEITKNRLQAVQQKKRLVLTDKEPFDDNFFLDHEPTELCHRFPTDPLNQTWIAWRKIIGGEDGLIKTIKHVVVSTKGGDFQTGQILFYVRSTVTNLCVLQQSSSTFVFPDGAIVEPLGFQADDGQTKESTEDRNLIDQYDQIYQFFIIKNPLTAPATFTVLLDMDIFVEVVQ